jgi:hypothetical protein
MNSLGKKSGNIYHLQWSQKIKIPRKNLMKDAKDPLNENYKSLYSAIKKNKIMGFTSKWNETEEHHVK